MSIKSNKLLTRGKLSTGLFISAILLIGCPGLQAEEYDPNDVHLNVVFSSSVPNLLYLNGEKLFGLRSKNYQCLLESLPFQYDISAVPYLRLENRLQRGTADLALLLSKTAERDNYAFFTVPVYDVDFLIVTKKDKIPEDYNFSSWTIGAVRGSSFADLLPSEYNTEPFVGNSWNSLFAMLSRGRIDAVFSASGIISQDVEPRYLEGLNQFVVKTELIGAYMRKSFPNSVEILKLINASIENCKTNTP